MRTNTDWFKDSRWGIFIHFLVVTPGAFSASGDTGAGLTSEDWNKRVNNFDVEGLARQLESVGAKYFFITIGQNSGHYCAPNATYDKYVGIQPSKCSARDLVGDLYDALNLKGIKLLAYLTSGAPSADTVAMEKLGWEEGFKDTGCTERTGKRLTEFQMKWEEIVREWSLRWGKKVAGWWIDGCYFADEMYRHSEPPNFQSFASALKAGNPDAIVAFNPGVKVPVISHTEFEDYTAGEISEGFPVNTSYFTPPLSRWVNGAQYHILSYLSNEGWGSGQPRFPDEFVIGVTKHINSFGGVVTWDVPITDRGLIPQLFMDQLMILNKGSGH